MQEKNIKRNFEITAFYSSFHFAWDADFVFHGESHEMWEIVFLKSGKVEVTENEKVYLLEKNNMIIHAPWEFHRIRSAGGTTPTVLVVSFTVKGEPPESLKEGIFSLSTDQGMRYSELCHRISDFLEDKSISAYEGQEAADALSAFLIRLSDKTVRQHSEVSAAAAEYRKVATAMTNGVCEGKTLGDFAHECGISISYMKLLFKEYAGISPKAYYTELRVRCAAEMLDGGVGAAELAERMNFSSSNYFSTFFKKHTGYSPLAYRNRKVN